MRRVILVSLSFAVLSAGCERGDVEAELTELRAENGALRDQIAKLAAENAQVRREITAEAARASAENARAIEEVRGELRAMRGELAGTERPEPAPLLVDPEVEERLLHKVEELREGVWELPPSGCVRILREIAERYPNTRAALRAQKALSEWEVLGVEVTDENVREIDERIRSLLKARAKIWHGIRSAMRAAERGEAEEAVRTLREIAEGHLGEPGRHALEVLENWGVADLDPAEIDFAELGPRIKREAVARREIERAFRSSHRGHLETAAKAFRKTIRKYPDLHQAERAWEGLEDTEAELRERREERDREREERRWEERRGERRRGREGRAEEREAEELQRGQRRREEREGEEEPAGEERRRERDEQAHEKKDRAPVF